jgi:hypothetical protein
METRGDNMLKNIAKLEVKVGDRNYQLFVDNDSPLNDIKDALFQFSKYVGYVEDQAKMMKEKADAEKAASEAPKDEEYAKIEAIPEAPKE